MLAELAPGIPVTTNFMNTFQPADYWKWAAREDVVTLDSYPDPADPEAHVAAALNYDLMRSLGGGRPWLLLEHAVERGQLARGERAQAAGPDAALGIPGARPRVGRRHVLPVARRPRRRREVPQRDGPARRDGSPRLGRDRPARRRARDARGDRRGEDPCRRRLPLRLGQLVGLRRCRPPLAAPRPAGDRALLVPALLRAERRRGPRPAGCRSLRLPPRRGAEPLPADGRCARGADGVRARAAASSSAASSAESSTRTTTSARRLGRRRSGGCSESGSTRPGRFRRARRSPSSFPPERRRSRATGRNGSSSTARTRSRVMPRACWQAAPPRSGTPSAPGSPTTARPGSTPPGSPRSPGSPARTPARVRSRRCLPASRRAAAPPRTGRTCSCSTTPTRSAPSTSPRAPS